MKKKNIILLIVCISTAIILAITLIGNANKNPLIGFWQEANEYNDDIRIFEFNENGYLTEMTLSENGNMNTNSYSYSFSERSKTVAFNADGWENNTYRYTIKINTLTLYDGDRIDSSWKKINSIDFLEKEQEKRQEDAQRRWEEEQRRKEEEQRRREEEERLKEEKMQKLRGEYAEYCENPHRDAEIKLLGKWVKDNTMFRDTYEFFEDGKVIHYSSDSGKTYTGTYHVYPYDFNLSDEQLLQFESGNFVPTEYNLRLNYEEGLQNGYTLLFEEDYIRFKDGPYGWGWRFDKID